MVCVLSFIIVSLALGGHYYETAHALNSRRTQAIDDVILYYEILDSARDVTHTRVRRSLADARHIRRVQFRTHQHDFTLNLRQNSDILTDDFRAHYFDANDGLVKTTTIDENTLYTGYIQGDDYSDAIIDICDDVITGTIMTDNDTIIIEALRNYDKDAPARQLIVYKESNLRSNRNRILKTKTLQHSMAGTVFEGINANEGDQVSNGGQRTSDAKKPPARRSRRSPRSRAACGNIPEKNLCPIYLVADYTYFVEVGGGDRKRTIYHMLQAIRVTDKLLKETVWLYGVGCHVGLAVKGITVYETDNSTTPSFNRKNSVTPEHSNLHLRRFEQDKQYLPNWDEGKFCLAHLFSYRDFHEGVLGLAYIGAETVSGICNERNVAFSNYFNSERNIRLITLVANLVTAHEIAHNFGARHDNTEFVGEPSCYPGTENGGNYLMYDTMLSGMDDNNDALSTCSKRSISKLLLVKLRGGCFVGENKTLCTNGIVDEGEACDPGIFGSDDECCDKNCQFKTRSECSDFNHVCCTNCKFAANRTKVCRHRDENHCHGDVHCDGTSSKCPGSDIAVLKDNSTCDFGRGNCMEGGCIPLCQQLGKTGCSCTACKLCCRDPVTGDCAPVRPQWDGTRCMTGTEIGKCEDGTCVKVKQKLVDGAFASLFEHFTFSKFGAFLKKNIVGTICVFSLLFWAPVACLVNRLDKKQDVEDALQTQWSRPGNNTLVLDRGTRHRLRQLFKREAGSAKRVSGARFHISS